MKIKKRAHITGILLLLAPALFLSCNPATPTRPVLTLPTQVSNVQVQKEPPTGVPITETPVGNLPTAALTPTFRMVQIWGTAEPAGCLNADAELAVVSEQESLAQADSMLELPVPLSKRILEKSWNAYSGDYSPSNSGVFSFNVENVQNKYLIQQMMNALHVAGFVTWLRHSPRQGLHILAIPLRWGDLVNSAWEPYIRSYWENSLSVPRDDPDILSALKLPPCNWMVEQGYAPENAMDWWSDDTPGWPDYVSAASVYLAATNEAASEVANKIGWLGEAGREGPNTMCGPLAWSILHDAGALPLDWGGWAEGPKSFWLARPRTNGRPWSLFPTGSYHVYSFREQLGKFDFQQFPLYPGDFLYTYSEGNGFDHMMVVTEVDGDGSVYTVTNKIQVMPKKMMTIERLLLLNLKDPSVGIAKNQWATDRTNGRTGHAGFDVFRWAWAEKDIQDQPAAYTVQPGDTLRLIALRWHTPIDQIARYNEITIDAALAVGQTLQIPSNIMTGIR
jgi:hypothetical protein